MKDLGRTGKGEWQAPLEFLLVACHSSDVKKSLRQIVDLQSDGVPPGALDCIDDLHHFDIL